MVEAKPDLSQVRAQIDGIDQQIQALIAERANWAHQVGKAKGKPVSYTHLDVYKRQALTNNVGWLPSLRWFRPGGRLAWILRPKGRKSLRGPRGEGNGRANGRNPVPK